MFELANFAETIIKTVQQPHVFCGASINIYWYFFGISFCWNQKKIDRQNSMRIICQYDHIFSHFFFCCFIPYLYSKCKQLYISVCRLIGYFYQIKVSQIYKNLSITSEQTIAYKHSFTFAHVYTTTAIKIESQSRMLNNKYAYMQITSVYKNFVCFPFYW